ncbi:MFS general substrate transporter [Mycena olivaceomarginata]|nr:MFS general substrate transporter [Mycena olivaceomarginata]
MTGASFEQEAEAESKVGESQTVPSLLKEGEGSGTKVDKHGLPLIPQPSSDPSDPLNFPQWLKIAILLQVSFLAGLGPLNQAVINPAYVPLAAHFHKTTVVASYQTTIAIAFVGVGSFLWVPLANTYGRRPLLLFTTLLAAASSLGSGKAQTWSQLIGTRVLNGIGTSSFFTLGPGMVSDCFFLHERGRAMGIFTVFLTNSAHVAPIPGGFLAQYVNYRWCYYLPAILDLTMFFVMLFCLPETIYVRGSTPIVTSRPILRRLNLWGLRPEGKHLKISDFWRPFQMVIYPSVIISAFYYSVTFPLSSILPAVTSATLFRLVDKFTTSQTGMALGFGTLIGSTLGELLGGIVIDRSMYLSRKGKGGEAVPEVRLQGIWAGAIIQPIGLLIWGFCWQYKTHWIGPHHGIHCYVFCYPDHQHGTLLLHSYKPQMPEVAQVFNFGRQTVGMTLGFWAIPMGTKIGYHYMSITLALIGLVTFIPVIYLMYQGKNIRERMGQPNFNRGL